ncbi:response regulator [Limnobacter sp.]|uniref:response regulator n=1 Tax=Limnobacter sp. TaxID=2003368 RepID=UPI0035133A82
MNSPRKVLHVEDDPTLRKLVKMALERIGGMEVLSCERGSDAVRQAPDYNPDIILLDAMMPEMDGPQTFKALTCTMDLSNTPVLFMTARVQAEELEEYRSLGAFGVIPKPFDPTTLHRELADNYLRYFNEARHLM